MSTLVSPVDNRGSVSIASCRKDLDLLPGAFVLEV